LLTQIYLEQKIFIFSWFDSPMGVGRLIVEVTRSHLDNTLRITLLDKWSARRIDL